MRDARHDARTHQRQEHWKPLDSRFVQEHHRLLRLSRRLKLPLQFASNFFQPRTHISRRQSPHLLLPTRPRVRKSLRRERRPSRQAVERVVFFLLLLGGLLFPLCSRGWWSSSVRHFFGVRISFPFFYCVGGTQKQKKKALKSVVQKACIF